ncbi:MAG: hypothetical protein ACRBB3_07665 [Alphaproteobacteria bacterium]
MVTDNRGEVKYKGDDPSIKNAMDRIKPITLENAEWSDDGYGVIDGFIAVVDGRDDLDDALSLARELIQKPEFEVVSVIRQSTTLENSKDKVSDLFWNAAFGKTSIKRPDNTSGLGSAKQGTVLLEPDSKNFYIKTPASSFSTVNVLRSTVGIDVPEFDYNKVGVFGGGSALGKDFKTIFGAAGRAFPEYMSVYLSNGASTSDPGVMHFDSGYKANNSDDDCVPCIRDNSDLPDKFLEAAKSRDFEPLPGGVTITASINGGGSIVSKTNPDRYNQYKEHEINKELSDNKLLFQDGEFQGHQGQDGDIMIMRNDRWPDDEHGNKRLPSDHCSTITNAYGNYGNHLGRIVGLMSSQVCYMSPQVHDQISM